MTQLSFLMKYEYLKTGVNLQLRETNFDRFQQSRSRV